MHINHKNKITETEIIINNDEVKDGKLSKQVGYNSGAGTQIPYTLILSAALSMLYNVRVNSVRLIFIDEPFEKFKKYILKNKISRLYSVHLLISWNLLVVNVA